MKSITEEWRFAPNTVNVKMMILPNHPLDHATLSELFSAGVIERNELRGMLGLWNEGIDVPSDKFESPFTFTKKDE